MKTAAFLLLASAAAMHAQYTGFSIDNMDKSVDPCTNFFQYSCGNWIKANPIPADRSSWGTFVALRERNSNVLRDILQTVSAKSSASAVEQKIGDHYVACMDEKAIDEKGITPLKPELDRIQAIKTKAELVEPLAAYHKRGTAALFNFYSRPGLNNSKLVIAWVDQGGLGLPDRDYYVRTDAKSVETRDRYVAHMTRMFELAGQNAENAAASAKAVMNIETALAKSSQDRVTRRNANNLNHPDTVDGLKKLAPSFDWARYFERSGAPKFTNLNIGNPEFVKGLEQVLTSTSLDDLKTYLSWHVLHGAAPMLSAAFVNENFEFYGKFLTGAKELQPRWKRCVARVDADLGEALGQKYVELAFAGESKTRMMELVKNLRTAMERDIQQIDWMTPDTKKRALEKLNAVTDKIGYPEKWRDYSKVKIARNDALGNFFRAEEFATQRVYDKIGKAPDPKEWSMTPPTVNAYYSPQQNNINFPAGILQPPFFDAKIDDAVNYGGIGAVIGHELTHGFDDSGRRFDAEGNLRDWWTPADAKAFDERADCVANQYGSYVAVDDVKLNGKLTLGENVADNGGLRIAYMALMEASKGKKPTSVDGLTPEQRFFLGWGQVWCSHMTPQAARLQAQTDPHSPGEFRVNGVVSNMPEFQKAFGCKVGQPMVRSDKACRVW